MNRTKILFSSSRVMIFRGLHILTKAENREIPALAWSFIYFFCLLSSYYILRPLRDEMGIEGGVDQLQWVFSGTFVTMLAVVPLFGWVSAKLPRDRLLLYVYGFFLINVLLFYTLFKLDIEQVYVARAFFIWVSVFNLFVVSVFWSFMADLFSSVQALRLFGFIAAGGSAGAIVGPLITGLLATSLGPINLLLVSAAFLCLTMLCIHRLSIWANSVARSDPTQIPMSADQGDAQERTRALGGGVFSGIRSVISSWYLAGICVFISLYTTLATFLYFTQAHLVSQAYDDPAQRTALFAWIDLGVNSLTLLVQLFLTGRIIHLLGLPQTLALVPAFMLVGFLALGLMPILSILIGIQVLRRAGNYALARPAREVLFTVVDREAKYKAKNFIDTVVYRGGDAISGWVYVALQGLGLSLSGIAYVALPVTMLWLVTGIMLGVHQQKLSRITMLSGKL